MFFSTEDVDWSTIACESETTDMLRPKVRLCLTYLRSESFGRSMPFVSPGSSSLVVTCWLSFAPVSS